MKQPSLLSDPESISLGKPEPVRRKRFSCFDDAIYEAAEHALMEMITAEEWFKQCYCAYTEALDRQKEEKTDELKKAYKKTTGRRWGYID